MDYDKIINGVMQHRVGEFIVTDKTGEILYRNHVEPFTNAQWEIWVGLNLEPENLETEEKWEISDKKKESYYSVISVPVTEDHQELIVHHIFNTTEYVTLLRDVSQYSLEWKNLSSFQGKLFENLTGDHPETLTLIMNALHLNSLVLYIGREHFTKAYSQRIDDASFHIQKTDNRAVFTAKEGQDFDLSGNGDFLYCFINGVTVDGVFYAVFVEKSEESTVEELSMYYHVIRMFLENSLMRARIVYENEHDSLTGLYNKGKFISLTDEFFPTCQRLAVFNMDVNYLKRTNDTLGHQAGDGLIIKSAKSLLAVEDEHIRGFRVGGDELMLMAWDLSEDEAVQLKENWEKALNRLNTEDSTVECVIACGLAYGSGSDLSKLLKQADERMYENKVAIKIARGDDPNGR